MQTDRNELIKKIRLTNKVIQMFIKFGNHTISTMIKVAKDDAIMLIDSCQDSSFDVQEDYTTLCIDKI